MTDEILDAVEPTAHRFAKKLHQTTTANVSQGLEEGLAIADDQGLDPDAEGESLILPALRWKTHEHLAKLNHEAAEGWRRIYLSARRERR